MTAPAWLDRAAYPFASHWAAVPGGSLHYVDEGRGAPVLMVHGTPTWSFLYRHLIAGLRDAHRCVAPDNLGFGLSDRPRGASYRLADQAARLAALVDTLGLDDVTLVVHDFGGPIGLGWALERPERVRALVLCNTWMWSFRGDRRMQWSGRLLGGPLGRLLYERTAFSLDVLWRRALGERTRYTAAIHAQYRAPLDPGATWAYARELLGASDWLDGLWRRRDRLAGIPALLVWGTRDPAFGAHLPRWREALPQAEVLALPDVGHAPPEERGPEVAAAVRRFIERVGAPHAGQRSPA